MADSDEFLSHKEIDEEWLARRESWCLKYHNRESQKGGCATLMLAMVERIRWDAARIKALEHPDTCMCVECVRVVEGAR